MRPTVVRTAAWLLAALCAGAAARAGETPGTAAGTTSRDPRAEATAAPGVRVERHSPRDGHPSLGPDKAKTTLIFFTDYQCPVCPRAARELDRLVADFNGELRVELHHNPLAMHPKAFDAASAARAAQRQMKFWEYHDALLNSKSLERDALLALAAQVGCDPKQFARDFDDPELRKTITADAKEANDVNALGTPGFLVNGHVEVGWASLPWLEQVIRSNTK